jgi:hypothetical protein
MDHGLGIHESTCPDTDLMMGRRMEKRDDLGESGIRIGRKKEWLGNTGDLFFGEDGRGPGLSRRRCIFGVRKERQVPFNGRLKRGHALEFKGTVTFDGPPNLAS